MVDGAVADRALQVGSLVVHHLGDELLLVDAADLTARGVVEVPALQILARTRAKLCQGAVGAQRLGRRLAVADLLDQTPTGVIHRLAQVAFGIQPANLTTFAVIEVTGHPLTRLLLSQLATAIVAVGGDRALRIGAAAQAAADIVEEGARPVGLHAPRANLADLGLDHRRAVEPAAGVHQGGIALLLDALARGVVTVLDHRAGTIDPRTDPPGLIVEGVAARPRGVLHHHLAARRVVHILGRARRFPAAVCVTLTRRPQAS